MKGPTRSPRIRRAMEQIQKLGYTVVFQDYVEDAETPGFLGQLGGITLPSLKKIKVRTKGFTREQVAIVLEHELEHAEGKERGTDHPEHGFVCGGMRKGTF